MGRLEPELDPWRDTRAEHAPGRTGVTGVTVLLVLVTVGAGVAALVSILS